MNAAYGTWTSPWTAESITATEKIPDLVDVVLDPITSVVYHIEKRPAEGGRNALVHTETRRDVTGGGDWDARSSVNGYGGAPAIVHAGVAYFSHGRDGRVYTINVDDSSPNNLPEAITPENPSHKFANFDVYPCDPVLLVGVMEYRTVAKTPAAVVNSLCILNVSTREVFPVTSDASFYASPKFSPDGKRVAWVEWDLPDMPWNGTEIWVADVVPLASLESLSFVNPRHVAGEHGKISVAYPSWLSNDVLLFTSDVSGFENPWTYDCIAGEASAVFQVPVAESFAYGSPPKVLGWSPYAPVADAVVFTAIKDGRSMLYRVDIAAGTANLLPSPYTVIQHLHPLPGNQVAFVGTQADAPPALIRCSLSSSTEAVFTPILAPDSHSLPREYIPRPRPISIPHPGTAKSAGLVHVVFYPPTNPEYASPDGEKPPLVIHVHGGPVGFSAQAFDRTRLFFTTRGWAWCDVNHGGTSGYGRRYMERLRGNWGVVDVEDCICAARALASAPYNLVDPKRIVVRGPSAGGFTVLSALSRYANEAVFAAGASLYGISDLRRLERETHKFESGYLRMLVGKDPEVLVDRSPVSHADKITVPLLILQGDSDTAVPPSQSEGMVESIRQRGGVVEYKLYAGEGHGWKRRGTIEDAIQTELRFYNRVLGIPRAESK